MFSIPFVSSETQVFCENMWNNSWHQIYLLGKDFLLTARFSSDSSVYHIRHVFHGSRARLTGSWTILNVTCLIEKLFNMVNMTFTISNLRRVCIFTALWPAFNKPTIVICMWNSVHSIIHITTARNQRIWQWGVVPSALHTVTLSYNAKFLITQCHWQYLWLYCVTYSNLRCSIKCLHCQCKGASTRTKI